MEIAGGGALTFEQPEPAEVEVYRGEEDVARILLHNPKWMLALPGRLYGMLGPGWQQETWRMSVSREGRGVGTPEKSMPWVTTNHLYSITGLETFDPDLPKELSTRPNSGAGRPRTSARRPARW